MVMKLRSCILVFVFVFILGCENPNKNNHVSQNNMDGKKDSSAVGAITGESDRSSQLAVVSQAKGEHENSFKPFDIYTDIGSRDNHYTPSGFMPNGKCLTFNDRWTEGCHEGSTCIKINYDLQCSREDEKWAGIYWLNPPNNWGEKKGGYDLTGATKLTFWAKGEIGGEQINEFTIGGITGNYPDSDIAVIGPVILMSEWRQYTIDLRGKDLSHISAGFAWSTAEEVNYDSCTFYLDDIRFE